MHQVQVNTNFGNYEITIERGLLSSAGRTLDAFAGKKAAVVTDANVAKLYARPLLSSLEQAGIEAFLVELPPGEGSKCHTQLLGLYDEFISRSLTRGDCIIALGGGVVGDLAGFAAASYLRGTKLVQVPTTLLAQVDSSVGGKVGVNLPQGKNLIGAFYQPVRVLIDPVALTTLDKRQFLCGMAEIVKYACIADGALFEQLERGEYGLEETIQRCCEIKRDYVTRDTLDTGARMELNFGHTLGHALETASGYGALTHGEAIAIGMVAAARLGENLGVSRSGTAERIIALLEKLGLPTQMPTGREALNVIGNDKKLSGDTVKFIMLERIGKASIVPTSLGALKAKLGELLYGS